MHSQRQPTSVTKHSIFIILAHDNAEGSLAGDQAGVETLHNDTYRKPLRPSNFETN